VPVLLAVYGSPRKGGNTSLLLDYFLEGAAGSICEVERIHIRELSFSHCTECGGCAETGICRLKDDMTPLYGKLLSAERIVMAVPVFFLGPPALTKAFIDRAQSLWMRKYKLGIKPGESGARRKGFMLSVGGYGGSERLFACNRSIVKAFYMCCGFTYSGDILVPGIDGFREIEKLDHIRENARNACARFLDFNT